MKTAFHRSGCAETFDKKAFFSDSQIAEKQSSIYIIHSSFFLELCRLKQSACHKQEMSLSNIIDRDIEMEHVKDYHEEGVTIAESVLQ